MKKSLWVVFLVVTLVASLALTGCGGKEEAKFPNKDITMVIAFTAGGSSDVQARIVEKYFKQEFGVNPVITYKTGAGGAVGFGEIAKAKPDGYTIGGLNVPHIVLQPLAQPTQFTPDSFAYIAQVVNDPQVIAVKKDSDIKDLNDLLERAKKNPEKITLGNVGTFTGHHIASLELMDKTQTKFTLIPYKGAADEIAALLGGHVDAIMGNLNDVMRDTDKIRVLAIATKERHPMAKDWPTFKEQGVDLVSGITRLFAAPKGTPENVVKRLREGFKNICNKPEYLEDMKKIGQPAEYIDGAQLEKIIAEENVKAKALLDKFGLLKK